MFNYSEGLQNPELTIRRLSPDAPDSRQDQVLSTLAQLMSLEKVNLNGGIGSDAGIRVGASWAADMPLRDLADGYKSTFLWVTDLLGWALDVQPDAPGLSDITGVVLVDELEQHLHPQWQSNVVHLLRTAFPKIQFIASTHSPLVTRSVGKPGTYDRDRLYHLSFTDDEPTAVQADPFDTVHMQTIDQILASSLFEWLIDEDPDVAKALRRASELLMAGDSRSPDEQAEYATLRERLTVILRPEGRTEIERHIVEQHEQEVVQETLDLRRRLDTVD